MKKIILLTLAVLVLGTQVFAADYSGFYAKLDVSLIQDITMATTTNMELDENAAGTRTFTVNCNFDNWSVIAYGPGLINDTALGANHIIALSVGTAEGALTSLGADENNPTTLLAGNFTVGAASYTLYLQGDAGDLAEARPGYYGAQIDFKLIDNL